MSSPRSLITSSTPFGTAMNRIPTTAKLTASRRRLRTTKRSARTPLIARPAAPRPRQPLWRARRSRGGILNGRRPIHPWDLESGRDRSRAGPARRAAGAAGAHRRGARADVRGASRDPRARRADERARPRRCPADLACGGARERAPGGRATPELGSRPGPRGSARPLRRGVPRAVPAGVSDLLALTAARAATGIAAGELSAGEYLAAYVNAAAGDDLNAYLWRQ